jgi:hypothetical protein
MQKIVGAPSVRRIVDLFFDAVEARDFEQAGRYLSPAQFFYFSPIESYDNAQDFIDAAGRVAPITKRIERRRMFIDGEEVCIIYNFFTTMDALASTRVAEWIKIKAGRIVSIEAFFDARAYASMFDP